MRNVAVGFFCMAIALPHLVCGEIRIGVHGGPVLARQLPRPDSDLNWTDRIGSACLVNVAFPITEWMHVAVGGGYTTKGLAGEIMSARVTADGRLEPGGMVGIDDRIDYTTIALAVGCSPRVGSGRVAPFLTAGPRLSIPVYQEYSMGDESYGPLEYVHYTPLVFGVKSTGGVSFRLWQRVSLSAGIDADWDVSETEMTRSPPGQEAYVMRTFRHYTYSVLLGVVLHLGKLT